MIQLDFSTFPILTSDRLILRQLTFDDEMEIYFIRTDPELNKYVNKPETKSLEDVKEFIEKINDGIANNECIYWVICFKGSGQFAGTICLWNIDKENNKAETGYTLLPSFQGKGIMYEALNLVIHYGFQNMKLNTIEAYTHIDNQSSFNLLARSKFKKSERESDFENKDLVFYYLVNETNSISF